MGYLVETKNVKVKIQTVDGKNIMGHINILGFDRLSDYLLHHNEEFIMIYNGGMASKKTIFIFKRSIALIEDETNDNKSN